MLEFALRTYLAANSTISAQVGAHIYPLVTPQKITGDRITYRRKSGVRAYVLDKGSDLSDAEIEIVCWSQSYDLAKTLSKNLRQIMHGFRGTWGSGGIQTEVKVVMHLDEEDGYEPPIDATDDGWFGVKNIYRMKYVETAPTLP